MLPETGIACGATGTATLKSLVSSPSTLMMRRSGPVAVSLFFSMKASISSQPLPMASAAASHSRGAAGVLTPT